MSNPAVITLADASSKKGRFKRFVLEDNIGESIHLHMDAMRLDFSIVQFLEFSHLIEDALNDMDILKGHKLEEFDAHFLHELSSFMLDLEKITFEEIALNKLSCIVKSKIRSHSVQKLKKIIDTPAYKFLQGDKQEFEQYEQFNYLGSNNAQRLNSLQQSIEHNGYPFNKKHIVLFEGQDIIRDGQHRAACLANIHGLDHTIKVMRFHFKSASHHVHITKENGVNTTKWIAKKGIKKAKKVVKKLIGRK